MTSKSVWNLPGGPWERIFAGVWNNFNVAVYENPQKVLLTTLFPKTGEVSWIMVRVDKVLLVPSGFERIEDKLADKKMHILKQRIPGQNMTYMILLSPPAKLDFGSKEIGSLVFQKLADLNKETEEVMGLARKAGVEVMELKDAPYKESASLLGNPTLLLSLLSIAPEGEEPKKQRLKEITLGENEEGLFSVTEDIFHSFSSVKKGTEDERNYLAQTILESSIIDASPIPLILDFSSHPLKLDQANPYPYDYNKYGFEHNTNFKTRSYELSNEKKDIKINLNHASPQFLWKLFGLGTDESSTMLLSAANNLQQTNSFDNMESLEKELSKGTSGKEEEAKKARAMRLLRTIRKAYGDVFSGENDMQKLIQEWVNNNDTVYFNMTGLEKRQRLAYALYILESIESLRISGNLSEIQSKRIEHVYPALISLSWLDRGLMQDEIVNKLVESKTGGLFTDEEELPMKIESRISNKFIITGQGKAKLYQGGRGTEFKIRPLLSCPP